jgi:predicted enzyme related to lactoylglutathione lyase
MGQPVVHFELWSKDPDRISDFYSKVFDWQIQSMPEMSYHIVQTGGEGGINGGMGHLSLFEDTDGRVMGMWKPAAM